MKRNDLLAYLKQSSYTNAYSELVKKWNGSNADDGDGDLIYDVTRQTEEWLTLHDSMNDGASHDSSWVAVYSVTTEEGDTVVIGEYNNNAWGVTDVLEAPVSCQEYLEGWDEIPEEFK